MKKRCTSVLLCIVLLIVSLSVSFTTSAKTQYPHGEYINYRDMLSNTYSKLTSGAKALNVVYFGGSVTAGHGATDAGSNSWRGKIGNWLISNFPDAKITNINRACGESGTYLGAYRFERDVIDAKPDLLFIEYAINDAYYGTSYNQTAIQYETIVRKVRAALPECDIVTILVTDYWRADEAREGYLHDQAQAHEDIADKYNISTIHVGRALADLLPNGWSAGDYTTDKEWLYYMADIVHPTNEGYNVYYSVIEEFMRKCLIDTEHIGGIVEHINPEMVNDNLYDGNVEVILPTYNLIVNSEKMGGKGYKYVADSYGVINYNSYLYTETSGSVIGVEFCGTELVMLVNGGSGTEFSVKIDGGEYKTKSFNTHNPTTVVSGLDSGIHKVLIRFDSLPNRFIKIAAFYSRDAEYQTAKTNKINTDKEKYSMGEDVTLGIVDETSADTVKVWTYGSEQSDTLLTQSVTSEGTQSVDTSSLDKGTYIVGVFDGEELVGSTVIEIVSGNKYELVLSKSEYEAGEKIYFNALNCTDAEWVGLYHLENYESSGYQPWKYVDGIDVGSRLPEGHGECFPSELSYQYKFEPWPFPPGEYIAVLFHGENNYWYYEQDTVKFTITTPKGTIVLEQNEFARGEKIEVSFKAYSEIDTIKMMSLEGDTVFEQEVTVSDTVIIDTLPIDDGEYTIATYSNGEETDSMDVYIDYNDFINDGTTINIIVDTYVDLSKQNHTKIDGKIFIGWSNDRGISVASDGYYSAGTVLTAQYIDYSCSDGGDYFIDGVQMKNTGTQSIRYVFKQSDAFISKLPTVVESGALLIEPEILNNNLWADLEYGRTYTNNGSDCQAQVLEFGKILSDTAGVSAYSINIDVTEEDYTKNYVVRGFIRYNDLNGVEQVLYTEPYQTSVFNIAEHTLKYSRGNITAEARANLNRIIDNARAKIKAKYDSQERITVTGSLEKPETYIYKLADSGMMIREVMVDSGLGGEPVEIVQLSDTHINYMNVDDFKEGNPTLISTYENRTWLKDASSVPTIRKVLDYASSADQIVITGDVIDYLSRGAVDLMWKEIWNFFPQAILANGNHDTYQKLGTVGDTLNFNTRYNWISGAWKHNFDYYSTVVKNKAMVIQLNNGQSRFEQTQIEPLKKDLALARAKGYPVFIFCHIPLYTANPNESDVCWIRYDDWSQSSQHVDFHTNSSGNLVGRPSDKGTNSATEIVYNLITNNGDIVKGVFNGHYHNDYYTEIIAKTASGADTVIPQYTMTASIYEDGRALKIIVK